MRRIAKSSKGKTVCATNQCLYNYYSILQI